MKHLVGRPDAQHAGRAILVSLIVTASATGWVARPLAAPAETLDPTCTTAGGQERLIPIGATRALVQTFTAATTTVGGFDALVDNQTIGARTFNGEIRFGGPTGAAIASTTARTPKGRTDPMWARFAFSPPVSVTPGQTYALAVYRAGYPSSNGPLWVSCRVDYPGGSGYASTGVYSDFGSDLAFRVVSVAVPPSVSIGDASILEGDGPRSAMLSFPVTLSEPATTAVTVSYTVAGVSATGADSAGPGVDFDDSGGATESLTFALKPNGKTASFAYLSVEVFADVDDETDETLAVTLTSATGGVAVGRSIGTGTILDDDPESVSVGIGDASIVKGRTAAQEMRLSVALSQRVTVPVTVGYLIIAGSATWSKTAAGGGDFGGKTAGILSFPAGATARVISVPIWQDPNPSGLTKSFTISLVSVSGGGASILRADATITVFPLGMGPNVPHPAKGLAVSVGDSCTASDPINGSVPGSEISLAWSAPTAGDPPTGYAVLLRTTLPDQAPTTESFTIAAPSTTTGVLCYPFSTGLSPSVAPLNDAGTTGAIGISGEFWVPPTGLSWTSPASVSDNVDALFTPTDPCPTTRPDGGGVIGPALAGLTLTTATATINRIAFVTGGHWSLTTTFDAGGVQDLDAHVYVQCVDFGGGTSSPTLIGKYAIHDIAVNP